MTSHRRAAKPASNMAALVTRVDMVAMAQADMIRRADMEAVSKDMEVANKNIEVTNKDTRASARRKRRE